MDRLPGPWEPGMWGAGASLEQIMGYKDKRVKTGNRKEENVKRS